LTASASEISNLATRQCRGTCKTPLAIKRWLVRTSWAILTIACLASLDTQPLLAQAKLIGRVSGTVTEVKPGLISIKSAAADTKAYLIQDKTGPPVMLGGRRTNIRGRISAVGEIPIKLIEQGMLVKVKCKLNGAGKTESNIDSVQLVTDEKADSPQVEVAVVPSKKTEFANTLVVGRVLSFRNDKLQLEVPKTDWYKKERLSLKVTEQATLKINDDSLAWVVPGDEVQEAAVFDVKGEQLVRGIKVKLTGPRDALTKDFEGQLQNQFSHLSDEPGEARVKRSAHFALHTDISDRQAQVLLAKLETMYELVSGYYQARPRNTIECYVVRDLEKFPAEQIPPQGRAKILEPAGVTISQVSRKNARAIVYSCDDQGVAQHEAVHAFCVQTFGRSDLVFRRHGRNGPVLEKRKLGRRRQSFCG